MGSRKRLPRALPFLISHSFVSFYKPIRFQSDSFFLRHPSAFLWIVLPLLQLLQCVFFLAFVSTTVTMIIAMPRATPFNKLAYPTSSSPSSKASTLAIERLGETSTLWSQQGPSTCGFLPSTGTTLTSGKYPQKSLENGSDD